MKHFLKILVVFLCLTSVAYSDTDSAQQYNISQILNLDIEAEKIASTAIVLANNIVAVLKQQGRNIDTKTAKVINLEVAQVMQDEFINNNWLKETAYAIYTKYLNADQLIKMLRVRSKQDRQIMAKIEQELVFAKKYHTDSIIPIIEQRLKPHLH